MNNSIVLLVPKLGLILVLMCFTNAIFGRRFGDEGYYPDGYDENVPYDNIKTALSKLEHQPQWVQDWPTSTVRLGQVSGVALDNQGRLLVFHRALNVWDASTFINNIYSGIGDLPIQQPTVLVFNDTGDLVDMWGQNLFYMPHGITVDVSGNVWVTDVAMHQVFKFDKGHWQNYSMVLGEKFVPRNDDSHFCKPSAVAVLPSGDFFVADGYCNHRIMKFAPDGTLILQWGRSHGNSPFVLNVPHALTLVPDRGLVCVADRERGRVACFRADNGTFAASYSNWLIGARLFSVAYAPVNGGRLYVVNGPNGVVPVRGYVIDFTTGRLIQTFGAEGGFSNPHDVVATQDGTKVYVAELNPYKVYKLVDETLSPAVGNQSTTLRPLVQNASTPAKPTATIEGVSGWSGVGGSVWAGGMWWWVGGAGLALGALALGAGLLRALHAARAHGRKSGGRRRWEYGPGEFKLRRLLERRRFTRVHSDDSDEEPSPMLQHPPAHA